MATTRLSGWGITADLPDQWEGRLYLRTAAQDDFADPATRMRPGIERPGSGGWKGEQTLPILHMGNFPLPAQRGDFGSGALDRMGGRHAFVALIDYGPDLLGTALFEPQGLPTLKPSYFASANQQRHRPGQLGFQHFCTVGGRPMCLFTVAGSAVHLKGLTAQINKALQGVRVEQAEVRA